MLGCVTNLDNKRLKNCFCVEGVVRYIFHGTFFFADYLNEKLKKLLGYTFLYIHIYVLVIALNPFLNNTAILM